MAEGQKNHLALVVVGLLMGILLASMDQTIVATAMGTIVSELGGMDKFVWVTSAYLVAEMAGMPIFGKLSDMYGRKKFFVFGLIMFMAGSALCGTADSIVQLSIYRAIQGIGGGAMMPIAFTIVFDVFPAEKRGKMGGLFGAVFGLSSIFGPLIGAYFTDHMDWRWCFYVNLPLGLISVLLLMLFYRESHEHSKQRIDWLGASTLVGAIVCLMFGLELGGNEFAWDSGVIISLFCGFVVLLVAFLMAEGKAAEPIIDFSMFKKRLFAASNLIALFSGATFVIATIYIPIFIQGVLGGTATNSGLVLLPMLLGSVVGSQTGAIISTKTSYRNVMVVYCTILVAGILLLGLLKPDISRYWVTIFMAITGIGVGATFSVLGMATIHAFEPRQRGSANSTLAFLRSLGITIGITIYGVLQRNLFTGKLTDSMAGTGQTAGGISDDPRSLLSPEARAQIPEPVLKKITAALSYSISHTFMWAIIPAVLALVFAVWMSRERLIVPARVKGQAAETAEYS